MDQHENTGAKKTNCLTLIFLKLFYWSDWFKQQLIGIFKILNALWIFFQSAYISTMSTHFEKKCRFLELSDQIRSKMYSCYRVCVIYRAIHIAGYAFFLKCCHLHMNHESPKNFILLLSIFYACEINNKYYVDWSYVTELYLCIFTGWSILKSQINHITESPKRL